jgi:hypothetical protein
MTMGKKNLEQLFKERFSDFQEAPDPKVWASIEASLDQKKQKKRAFPLWWSLGGVAAALVLLVVLTNPFAEDTMEQQVVSEKDNLVSPDSGDKLGPGQIENGTKDNMVPENEEGIVSSTDDESTTKQQKMEPNNSLMGNQVSVVQKTEQNRTENRSLAENKNNRYDLGDAKTQPLQRTDREGAEGIVSIEDTDSPSKNQSHKEKIVSETEVAESTKEQKEAEKQSIFDAIAEQNEIEEAVAKNKSGKWSVGPSVAPVYFDASGSGSPIDPSFASNSKSGNVNLSYGLNVAYEVGKKLKIRSGVHRVNFGYNTDDVVFSSALRSASNDRIQNINYDRNAESIIVESKNNAKNSPVANSKEIALNEAPAFDGAMVQQLGYIEVPLELNYAVVDKRFGVDLIGGVSSLFLVDNAVLLESNDLVTEVGEANNINSMNFSANVGMGLNYKFSPKIQINVEPVFKYQLNTFSNVSGSFRPYSIGVYSGFSFRF